MKFIPSILTVTVSILWVNSSFCQGKKIDSLLLVLGTTKEDTAKANTLNALSEEYLFRREFEKSLGYSKEALSLAQNLDFKKGEAAAYRLTGIVASHLGKYTVATSNHFAALKLSEQLGDKTGIARYYQDMGLIYYLQENDPEALNNFYKAMRLFEQINDLRSIVQTLTQIGGSYYYLKDYPESEKNHLNALKINEEIGDKEGIAYSTKSLGILSFIQANAAFDTGDKLNAEKKYLTAIEKHLAAIKIYEEFANKVGLLETYPHLGDVYEKLGTIALDESNMQRSKKNFMLARQYYFDFLKIAEGLNDENYISEACNRLGSIHINLKDYSKARKFLERGLLISAGRGYKVTMRDGYERLAKLDSREGNYANAFRNYKMFILYRDSLGSEEISRKTVQTKMQYEFDKKEDSLKQKQVLTDTKLQTQKNQRYFYWGGLAMLAALSFFVFLNFRNQKKINRLAGDAHAKEKAELELQSLRAQLNPHFMFNSLNAIQELILLEENEKSQSYLARFAKLLRMLLENAERPFIPLQREIDFLQLYLSLENLRIPDLQHSITIDPAIDTERAMIPNMILQPYIENAIWHGLSHKSNDKNVQIRISKTNGFVQYEIEDNGVGRKKSAELKSLFRKEHKSKGMELLSKRFKLLAKEYGSDIETTITDVMNNDEVAGTLVTINVPSKFSETNKNLTS